MTLHVFGKYNTRLVGGFRLYRNIQRVLAQYQILKTEAVDFSSFTQQTIKNKLYFSTIRDKDGIAWTRLTECC